MWWIIASVVVLIVIFVINRLSKISRQLALVTAIQGQAQSALAAAGGSSFELADYLWDDRYLLGYIQGLAALTAKFYGGKLTTEQKGMLLIETIRRLNPPAWRSVCDRMNELAYSHDEAFVMGIDDAANVVGLAANRLRPECLTDPDIQAAMANTPKFEQSAASLFGPSEVRNSSPFATAAIALMFIYMRRHKERMAY